MGVHRYPGIEADGERPEPGERVEDYRTNDTYRAIWMTTPTDLTVERQGDDVCLDSWVFGVERVGDAPPFGLRLAPKLHRHTKLDASDTAHDCPIARSSPPQRRAPTTSRTVAIDDLPDAVREYVESIDPRPEGVEAELVPSLGESGD